MNSCTDRISISVTYFYYFGRDGDNTKLDSIYTCIPWLCDEMFMHCNLDHRFLVCKVFIFFHVFALL